MDIEQSLVEHRDILFKYQQLREFTEKAIFSLKNLDDKLKDLAIKNNHYEFNTSSQDIIEENKPSMRGSIQRHNSTVIAGIPVSKIDAFLQEDYNRQIITSSVFRESMANISSYALKLKKHEILKAFDYLRRRITIFSRIWILIEKKRDDVVFLIKHATNAKKTPQYFYKELGLTSMEFYLLNKGKKTPKQLLSGFLMHNFLKNGHGKPQFLKNILEFAEFGKYFLFFLSQ